VNKSNFTCIKYADKEHFKTTETEFSIQILDCYTLSTCCCCQWRQSHVIHCHCNICFYM